MNSPIRSPRILLLTALLALGAGGCTSVSSGPTAPLPKPPDNPPPQPPPQVVEPAAVPIPLKPADPSGKSPLDHSAQPDQPLYKRPGT